MKQWIIDRKARLTEESLDRELSTTRETTDLVATIDLDGFMLSLNPSGFRILGLSPNVALHRLRLIEYYDEDSRRQFMVNDIPKALEHHVWHSERALLRPGNTKLPCSQILIAHKDKTGVLEYFSVIAHDITVIKNTEEERNQLRDQLFQSRKMETIGRLAGGVAHDFNNFLTVIMGYAELGLINDDINTDVRSDLQVILDTAKKAARLTGQLLDYSSKKMIEPQILHLNQVIAESEQLLETMISEKVKLIFELDPQLWPVKFDRTQLEQILFNLAVNARDAMLNGGTLTIRTKNRHISRLDQPSLAHLLPGEYICLYVRDTGMGMSQEIINQIFEPFFTTKEQGKGTGLGLSAVYGAIKQNNADIQVNSTPGQGTSFEIIIPAMSKSIPDHSLPVDNHEQFHTEIQKRKKILLVEDNDEVRTLVAKMLQDLGYDVITACDGLEGEKVFAQGMTNIDMLISDVVMPGKDGVQLAHQCQQLKPALPVLLISGHNEEILFFHDKKHSNIKMLNKPFSPQKLATEVRNLMQLNEQDIAEK